MLCGSFALPAMLPLISPDLKLTDSQGALLTVGYTVGALARLSVLPDVTKVGLACPQQPHLPVEAQQDVGVCRSFMPLPSYLWASWQIRPTDHVCWREVQHSGVSCQLEPPR